MTNLKKYTNADFYKNGVFQQEIAIEAMKEMFVHYNIPFTGFMAENMWVTDFGLGDFENVGMGGIFWVNDPKYGYFAHAIYLLPGQMIPEHAHVKTDFPALVIFSQIPQCHMSVMDVFVIPSLHHSDSSV